MTTEERVKQRFRFLKALYDRVGDNIAAGNHYTSLADDIGSDHSAAARFAQHLHSQGLLSLTNDGQVRITHIGVREIEAAVTKPQLPTQHFPAYVINIQTMTNSSIQQGTQNSSSVIIANQNEVQSLKQLVTNIKESADKISLSSQERTEMEAELQTLESQLSSPKPKHVIVSESLRTLRTILENAGAALLAAAIQAHLKA
jgi:hypothetical protein